MKRVLLTGANNLIGSHILHQLLAYNLSVRAVVASRGDAQVLQQLYSQTNTTRLDFAIVSPKDFAFPGAYDDALRGYPQPFDTVIHTLATDPSEEADCLSRFITFETDTLINFVKSVNDVAPGVQRVIVITSLTPFARWLVDPMVVRSPSGYYPTAQRAPEIDTEYVLATSQASDNIVYDALRRWIRNARPRFDLVAVTTPSVYGPSLRPLENSSDLEEANRRVWNICSNDANEHVTSPPYGIDFFADVRDLASATVQAVLRPQAGNRRFVVSAGTMPPASVIADFLASRFPELRGRLRSEHSPPRRPPSRHALELVDTRLAASVLGLARYHAVEETLTDIAGQILELHRRKEWRRVTQS